MDTVIDLANNNEELGLDFKESPHGIIVSNVVPGSPAQRAGVRPGAHISAVNDVQVTGKGDVLSIVGTAKRSPSPRIKLSLKDGRAAELLDTPASSMRHSAAPPQRLPPDATLPPGTREYVVDIVHLETPDSGIEYREHPSNEPFGAAGPWVRISSVVPGCAASLVGLPQGVLKKVNRIPVKTVQGVQNALANPPLLPNKLVFAVTPFETRSRPYDLVLPNNLTDSLGLKYSADSNGLVIYRTDPGTPAARSGMPAYKRIKTVNGYDFVNERTFLHVISGCRARGDKIMRFEVEGDAIIPGEQTSEPPSPAQKTAPARLRGSAAAAFDETPHLHTMSGALIPEDDDFNNARHSVSQFPGLSAAEKRMSLPPQKPVNGGQDPRDSEGYVWLRIQGEDRAFTLQPHHIAGPNGEQFNNELPSIGMAVRVQRLTRPGEKRFNGALGLVIPPGEHGDASGDSSSDGSRDSRAQSRGSVHRGAAKKKPKILPPTTGDTMLFRSMISPYGKRRSTSPNGDGRATDWQQWLKHQQQAGTPGTSWIDRHSQPSMPSHHASHSYAGLNMYLHSSGKSLCDKPRTQTIIPMFRD
ncbi:hypothetical protein DIPPA_18779 [Diplonema papillatum]|nr:hypothetical protein DIPPA_18779 [Diplonema papillatum]